MAIRIALIGSEETLQKVKALDVYIEDIELLTSMYQTPTEASELVTEVGQCDVILFSGGLPFYYAQKEIARLNKPALYIPDNELSVAYTLLHVTNNLKIELDQLSIDLIDRKFLQDVIQQLNIERAPTFIQDYPWLNQENNHPFQLESVINRHVELWESKQISYVVTSIHAVYDKLTTLHIPCIRLMEPAKNIVDSLIEARNLGALNRAKQSQIAVGAFVFHSHTPSEAFEFELQKIAKQINCSVKILTPLHFLLYGTRSGMEYLLENMEILNGSFQAFSKIKSSVSVGFGYGMTIVDAEKNANIALSYAQKDPSNNNLFVVNEKQEVTEPLRTKKTSSILQSENMKLIHISKELGISVTNLNKMIQFYQTRPINRFTSTDIAEYFGVGKRAAERIIKKFSDGGYLKVIGEEQPHLNGRPRSIYRLELPRF
ncbi:hypothetical protein [Bacillus sp. FJAT-22090]|uniref:hypothetical protein n=1 Tax=Bacillus sp. FJAT-22090 TaxID=1581038 RepID=UPI0011A30DD2|nr:hypothetical protein [Bacillus sp. FJAT-22090]